MTPTVPELPHLCEIRWRGECLGLFYSNIGGDVDLPDKLDHKAAYAARDAMKPVATFNEGSESK